MHLEPRVLMQLSGLLDLREGKFFASCFGNRVPDDLLAAVTVHGAATNKATAGFASPSRAQSAMPVEIEHWDDVPPHDGDWDTVLSTTLCVDTSGTVELFSPADGAVGEIVEFPMARGYYVVEACARHAGDGADEWRLRLWHSDEVGPDLKEIREIALLAR
ncbi:putative protein OS=Tsukamurella paurometabola (strain ATCC 8368 / DSM / CCUG 35730 /CIP 100753 / JCM 10117 / KCTC 9821 / NBRC 16120 / NCIMB 702349/ NCTC 13040) OX=521096 GN=Tpau_0395 PE=4 SV=1 [Tsukamurella paurometabola]|uniref:Uncharacterized protein n=1 Tax=Tsukamurella paurometabola (strain ATCC 8368 / DSM 20162 / CCUG 35730 / CIP 100753 / JCM 10117 / KCTC 9821 / NBRC 16120 / NCIMB 702349 / NCTC 13040) TaxID=521096 RepID=D5URI3_TSUPD|nr:hypothetical protein [Tsukamurella paurometabola]ADG77036.1 hypothetical protein Tpau_0395 [Tsukamurella paurometabola DSM 20162]SUP42550.1 Uncharacterised protein [Tsukamurella paurometabola]